MNAPTETGSAYAFERTPSEYERLRAQSRGWEAATVRAFDTIGIPPGASCLDAGCGPGETMRLLADRAGPSGSVTGIDADAGLGPLVEDFLRKAGYGQCRFLAADLNNDGPVPGGPYDVVFARLLLFHLPQRLEVLRRLWDAVAPGGHLLVQDYDFHTIEVLPPLASADEVTVLFTAAFHARGCDTRVGLHMRQLFIQAGIGVPDGVDVAGRVQPLGEGSGMFGQVLRGVLSTAIVHGLTDAEHGEAAVAALDRDAAAYPDYTMVWPTMLATWKQRA